MQDSLQGMASCMEGPSLLNALSLCRPPPDQHSSKSCCLCACSHPSTKFSNVFGGWECRFPMHAWCRWRMGNLFTILHVKRTNLNLKSIMYRKISSRDESRGLVHNQKDIRMHPPCMSSFRRSESTGSQFESPSRLVSHQVSNSPIFHWSHVIDLATSCHSHFVIHTLNLLSLLFDSACERLHPDGYLTMGQGKNHMEPPCRRRNPDRQERRKPSLEVGGGSCCMVKRRALLCHA